MVGLGRCANQHDFEEFAMNRSPYAIQPVVRRRGMLGRAMDSLGLIACVVVMGVLCAGMLVAMSRVAAS